MSDQSQATAAETTESVVGTEPTKPAAETTSTTKSQETAKSSESEGSLVGTKTEVKAEPGKEGEKPKAEGAPATYADFKAPEGYELDKALATEAGVMFKEMNLTQEQAQTLVDFYSAQSTKSSNLALQSVRDMRAGWVDQIKSNPEYKGDFDAQGKIKPDSKVLVGIGRMLDSLGDAKLASEFRQAMGLTGAGDHPAVWAMLHRLSNHFAEGSSVRGNGPSAHGQDSKGQAASISAASAIYPNLPSAAKG